MVVAVVSVMDNFTPQIQQSKLIRPPTLKRGRSSDSQSSKIKLERVIGLTVSTNSSLDVDGNTGTIAYPAGCTVVFHNPVLGTETHLSNVCRKSITCLTFSSDGRYLGTGECGHQSNVRVWDMNDYSQVAEFPGHKYGINCVAFSPNQKYLVSVGSQHDMIVNVWEWKSNLKYASNKVSAKIKAIAFSDNGNFITIGNRHVKFWYLQSSRSVTYKEPVPLMGRSAILGEQRNNDFVDVCCGCGDLKDYTYAITKSGLLCEFNNRRLLDRWVELKTTSANCMTIGNNYIFVGCAEGIVRCFNPGTLQFVTTLPRTHYLGVDVAQGHDISHMASIPSNAKYPDAIALAYDEVNTKLTCVYNDHSLYIWDVKDIKRVGKSNSFLFHSACIWGVEMYPELEQNLHVPKNSFITCSSDDTIRVWNLDKIDFDNSSLYQKNIYSNELLKVIYIDPELNFLKNTDLSLVDKTDSSSYDGRNGVRAIRISPDGVHLASGDRSGNIRVHDLKTLREVCLIEAHDAEVLYLDYSKYNDKVKLFASASRDRLIHVFNVNKGYDFTQTLDDHSSSITAVRFINSQNKLQMVSCGADKSIIFRNFNEAADKNQGGFIHDHSVSGKTTFYDMEVDPKQKHIMTACQDRNIRVYNTTSGKHTKTFKGSVGDEGSLIKVVLDRSGSYIATSCTDKTLCVYDYLAGECLTTMYGHSELVTGLRFTNDSKHLISASGDGCIFVWRMPSEMVKATNLSKRTRPERAPKPTIIENENVPPYVHKIVEDKENNSFSIPADGQLPLWAKKQVVSDYIQPDAQLNISINRINAPKGQWAQRATNPSEPSSILQLAINKDDSDCFKDDSSVDSGTETSRSIYPESQKESLIIPKKTKRIPPVFVSNDFDENLTAQLVSEKSSSHISDIHRVRNLTDDSSLGSFKNEELESNDHDGDIEDSEGEWATNGKVNNPILYYPSNTDDLVNDYTITKLDSDTAIRMSQRKSKGIKPKDRFLSPGVADLSSHSMSGSQGSDDEDDDATSTPSGDNSDKSNLMIFSTSTERLDMIEKREQFLKNTFESLGEGEQEFHDPKNNYPTKRSISSQYKGSTVQQNTNIESQSKRNELQQRIEETRRTLQNLGNHSNLKTSQSICDLSRNFGKSPSKLPVRNNQLTVDNHINMGGSIRRVCSLTDLSASTPSRNGHTNGSFNNNTKPMPRSLSKKPKPTLSSMQRSNSVNVLDQSDSESDASQQTNGSGTITSAIPTRIMRPTISSQNKVIANKSNILRRRSSTASQSTTALNVIGHNEDSSSEEFFTSLRNRAILISSQSKLYAPEKPRRNTTALTRSVSEMNLKSPSNKPSDKPRIRNDLSLKLKMNGSLSQQKNLKNHLSLMANQLFQTADTILEHLNGINVTDNKRITKGDIATVVNKLEQIVDNGGLFSQQSSSTSLSNTQQYLDVLVDLVKKRSSLTDM